MSNEPYIHAFVPEVEPEVDPFKDQDPFAKNWDNLKNLSGLEKNFKRRTED